WWEGGMKTLPDHTVRTGRGAAGSATASATLPVPAGSWWSGRRRRPTGEPPPLPRHLKSTGVGGLGGGLSALAASRSRTGLSLTVVDTWVLAQLAGARSPGLTRAVETVSGLLGSLGMVKVVGVATLLVL